MARSVYAVDGQPYGLHFEGRRFMPSSPIARYIELDTAEAFDGLSGERPFGIPPSMYAFAQSWMGKDSVAMAFLSSDYKTSYVCQLALDRKTQRLLADGSGLPYDRQLSLIESDERHVVLSLGDEIFALDTADGSRHPLTEAPPYRVTNLSVIAPRIVFAGPDGDVHAVNMETWADEKLTQDPTQQDMAASDGERVVWVDLHESPPEVPMSDIVVYSLADKTTTRLDEPASSKLYPTVEGDWVAWMDDRDSDMPNNPNGYGGYAIYGYNLKTKKEVVLVPWTANHWARPSLPRLYHGKLYVLVGGSRYGPPWLVEQAMPE